MLPVQRSYQDNLECIIALDREVGIRCRKARESRSFRRSLLMAMNLADRKYSARIFSEVSDKACQVRSIRDIFWPTNSVLSGDVSLQRPIWLPGTFVTTPSNFDPRDTEAGDWMARILRIDQP